MRQHIGFGQSQMTTAGKRARIIAALTDNPNAARVDREIGGVSYETVWRIAKAAGIALAGHRAAKNQDQAVVERRELIIAALRENPNAQEVGRRLGVNVGTVWRVARVAGIRLAAAKTTRPRRISPEERQQIIAALEENPHAGEVARQTGVQQQTIKRIAEAAAIELRGGKAKYQLAASKITQIVDALQRNPNVRQVAREIGDVSPMVVMRIAKGRLPLPNGAKISAEQRTKIIAALRENPNAAEVARQIGGVNRKTIWRIAKATGIALAPAPRSAKQQDQNS
jgi:transposase-like protein